MKSLKDQIEFIDKKLIVLFGFKGITDYAHTINITDVDTIKIDLTKLNELIPEFRKVFHAKNFSLHKTDYKIQTEVQAVCLLKTCLEVTSIPFDVSLKKNKRTLRLISKNNVLEDYINTLKMSENGILQQNPNQVLRSGLPDPKAVVKPWIPGEQIGENLFFLGADKPAPDTIVSPWLGETIDNNNNNDNSIYTLNSDIPNPKAILKRWIPQENNTTQKYVQKYETITKEMLNQSIKTTLQYSFSVDLNNKLITKMRNSGIPSIEIDLKKYEMSDKSVKGCVVSIKSKTINGNPIVSQDFINGLLSDVTWDLCIGGQQIYEDRFVNNQEIIISNIIIVCKCLSLHNVVFRLQNINKLMNYLDMLEIEFDVTYVKFYTELDNILTEKNWIYQQIEHHSLFNTLRIGHGMAGLAYSPYQTKEDYLVLESGKLPFKSFEEKYQDELIEKLETKPYKCVSMPNLNGLEIIKYDHKMFKSVENGYMSNKYDYITWKDTLDLPIDFLQYYKIIKGDNSYIHCYEIPLSGTHDTIKEISLQISDFTFKTCCIGTRSEQSEPLDIEIEFLDFFNKKVQEGPINKNIFYHNCTKSINIIDNIFLEDQHLLTHGGIGALKLKIKSNSSESPIKSKKNISLTARYYSWNHKYILALRSQYCGKYDFVYPNKLNKLN